MSEYARWQDAMLSTLLSQSRQSIIVPRHAGMKTVNQSVCHVRDVIRHRMSYTQDITVAEFAHDITQMEH